MLKPNDMFKVLQVEDRGSKYEGMVGLVTEVRRDPKDKSKIICGTDLLGDDRKFLYFDARCLEKIDEAPTKTWDELKEVIQPK